MDSSKRFVRMMAMSGAKPKPKWHLLLHVAQRAVSEGSPQLHATWADETLNRTLAVSGAVAHRAVWPLRVLTHFEQATIQKPPGATPKKRARK